jgi:hypothetical protein
MLIRDRFSGTLREAPDLSEYDLGEVVYDGLGHPVAVAPAGLAFDEGLGGTLGLPFLLPLLPAIAGAAASALPAITKALPAVTGMMSNLIPRSAPAPMPTPPAMAPASRPVYVTNAPSFPSASGPHPGAGIAPGPSGPIVFRRYRRRSAHAR